MRYGPYCPACGDEYDEHRDDGCHAVHEYMGPSDNMDIDWLNCDCAEPRLYTRQEVDLMIEDALTERELDWNW